MLLRLSISGALYTWRFIRHERLSNKKLHATRMQPSLFKLHLGTTRFFPLRCFGLLPAYAVHLPLARLPFLKAFGRFTAAKSVFSTHKVYEPLPSCTSRLQGVSLTKCRRLLPAPAALAFWLRLQRFNPFSACVRHSMPKHRFSNLCPHGCFASQGVLLLLIFSPLPVNNPLSVFTAFRLSSQ